MTKASDRAASRWDVTTPSGYNPNAHYTQASDKQGHSAKLTVKVPVNIAGEINAIIQSGKISELKSSQDFVRDAIIHHLHRIQPIIDDPEFTRKLSMWTIHDDAMRKKSEREEYTVMIDSIEAEIAYLSSTRQDQKLRSYLIDLLDKAEIAIPEVFRRDFIQNMQSLLRTMGGSG